jgi:ligand-binding sensor domain-containing protein
VIDFYVLFKIVLLLKHYILNNHTRIFLFIFFLFFSFAGYAQEPIYKHFGVDEGLPSSQVYDVYQSNDGYIWFATDKGVSRFNGYEFENFDINDGLPGNVVLRFYPQENGQVWGYTFHTKSLFYFDENFDGFTNYKYNKILSKELNASSTVKSVFIDDFNTFHLGGVYINGLLLIKENGQVNRKHTSKSFFDKNVPTKYITLNDATKKEASFFITADKEIINWRFINKRIGGYHIDVSWLTYNKKAVFINNNSVKIISNHSDAKLIESQHVSIGLRVIDSTRFFVGYKNGGGKIINDKGKILQEYLKGKSVTSFLKDHEGGYWFTTLNTGVYYLKKPSIAVFKPPNRNASFHVNSLSKKNNDLLIGYKNGSFAKIGDNKSFKFEKGISTSFPSVVEYDYILDKVYVYKNDSLEVNNVYVSNSTTKLSEPILNTPVFSSHRFGFLDINNNINHTFPKRIQDVSIWEKDTLIATPFGVFKQLKDSILVLSNESKLLRFRSDDIDVSFNGDCFYIATQGAGVVVYGKEIYNISKEEGLTSNIVNEIHVENDSTIWACTNKGLNRIVFYENGFKVKSINKNTGLLSNEVEDVEIINDTLWVGTRDGLSYMPKHILDNKPLDNIYLKLKEVRVNNIIYNFKERPKLNYDENKITFLVQGISYAKNNDLEYQYRLKEIDSKWSSTKNRKISFPNLEDGKYTFQVSACIGSKCYTEKQLEYKFIINPPFWRSWWFRALSILVFSGLFYVFFRIRVLTYNKDIIREFIRLLIKRLKRDEKYLEIRMNGESIKVASSEILFIKSSGNYLDIITTNKTYIIRSKIGDFIATTPDALEYLRVHRSYIIRIDKVTGKSKKSVTIEDYTIPVGETYIFQLNNIHF